MSRTLSGSAALRFAPGDMAKVNRNAPAARNERRFVMASLCIFRATDASRTRRIHNLLRARLPPSNLDIPGWPGKTPKIYAVLDLHDHCLRPRDRDPCGGESPGNSASKPR